MTVIPYVLLFFAAEMFKFFTQTCMAFSHIINVWIMSMQNVEVPKDILKFCQDINVELNGEDKISGFGAEKDHVSILPFSYVIMAEIVCAALINVPQRCKVLYFIVSTMLRFLGYIC